MPRNKTTQTVERADCIDEMWKRPGSAHLIVSDPPYNFDQMYSGHDDNLKAEEYLQWTHRWLDAAHEALHKHGTLWVFVPDEWVSDIDVYARRSRHMTKQNHIIWAFTFGQAAQGRFTRSHCHILCLSKTKTKWTFNAEALRVPSARQLVYGDKRANAQGKLPDDTWMLLKSQLEPYMTPDRDVWLESRVCGTFKARKKHSPNQLPLPLFTRIVTATSRPGDTVLDPFCGTGGLGVVCRKLGRHYIGYDKSPEAVKESRARILHAESEYGSC